MTEEHREKEGDPFEGKSIYEIMMLSQSGSQETNQDSLAGVASAVQPNFYYSYENALALPQNRFSSVNTIQTSAGSFNKLTYLPYHLKWQPVAGPSDMPINQAWLTESCAGKAAIGIFGGGVMGLLMGVFLGAMSDMTPPVTVINGKEVPQAPIKEQMRTTIRATGQKSLYWCRQFAFITGVFSGTECIVEKSRGRHDVWNEVLGGCVTGAAMQGKHGPQAAAVGCGGFAAFSLVIAQVMGTH